MGQAVSRMTGRFAGGCRPPVRRAPPSFARTRSELVGGPELGEAMGIAHRSSAPGEVAVADPALVWCVGTHWRRFDTAAFATRWAARVADAFLVRPLPV
jgi:hypothetical protein